MMGKFKLFFLTGTGFRFNWAINMKTGINLDDPNVYVASIFNALNSTTGNSSYNTISASDFQSQVTSQLVYVSLIIQLFPIVPLIAAFMTKDVKGNLIAYIEGIVIGFLITYLIILIGIDITYLMINLDQFSCLIVFSLLKTRI